MIKQLNEKMRDYRADPGATLAVGMSEYKRGEDSAVIEVFTCADHIMYQRKNALKLLLGRI